MARRLESALGVATELVRVSTRGDRIQDVALAAIGGKGLFVKEVEAVVLAGGADLAVHSAKDLPGELAEGLVLAAFPERADPRDALVAARAPGLAALPKGARVGTGSLRRRAQLLVHRPDLAIVPMRGNVDTRLRKLGEDGLDAVVLACAGLDRLGRGDVVRERIPERTLLPAPGQGTLAIQARRGSAVASDLGVLDCPETRDRTRAERAVQAGLGGDCHVPLAAYATLSDGTLRLEALLASRDGATLLRSRQVGPRGEAEALAAAAVRELRDAGGAELLERLRAEAPA